MAKLHATEAATYAEMWQGPEAYRENSPGEQLVKVFQQIVGKELGTVLDAGAGSGKGAVALEKAGFTVLMCDVTDAGLMPEARSLPFKTACVWHDLYFVVRAFGGFDYVGANRTRVDYVYCCDVLEHVPPQFTMLAIDQMLRVANKGLFLSVSLVDDTFGVWVGKRLHQTVQPFTWWRDSLRELGTVTEARDLITSAVFYVEPKR